MKIGVISDTHGKLHPGVLEVIGQCDAVCHAGDVADERTLDTLWMHLRPGAPFYLVRGNNDKGWAERIAKVQKFSLGDVRICMVHDKKDMPWNQEEAEVLIYGHSHRFSVEEKDGKLWLNPGSCGRARFGMPLTMAVLTVENETWTVEKITFLDGKVDNRSVEWKKVEAQQK